MLVRALRWQLACVIVLFVAAQIYFWGHTTDDAYITFRYIDRFATGHGLTFNNGVRVEGYSSPLWALLLCGLKILTHVPLPLLVRILGILCAMCVGLISFKIVRKYSTSVYAIAALFVVLILNPGFLYYSGGGLEVPLLELLLVLGVWEEAKDKPRLASIAFGLAAITRPEGILFTIAWCVWLLLKQRERAIFCIAVSLIFVIAWEIFRIDYYHAWIANTGLAKPWFGLRDLGFRQFARYLVPPIFASIPFLLSRRKIQYQKTPQILLLVLLIIVAELIFVIYAQTDWMYFGRFMQPVSPMIAIVIAIVISRIEMPQKFAIASIACLAAAQVGCWLPQTMRYIRNDGFAMLMRDNDPLTAGYWIHAHLPSDLTLATSRLGALSYTNMERTLWDFDGLTDRQQALFNLNRDTGVNPISKRHPHIIVEADVPSDWSYRRDSVEVQGLESSYRMIKQFPQGKIGTLDVWLLKQDSLRIFALHDD